MDNKIWFVIGGIALMVFSIYFYVTAILNIKAGNVVYGLSMAQIGLLMSIL